MQQLQKLISGLNTFQQRHKGLAFSHAVIKKFGEAKVGYQVALLTYYSFLALFPLLLVLTTLTERFVGRYPHLEATIVRGVTDHFPLLGNQLAAHIHGLHSSGLALVAGVLFTLYGARGVAAAFRHGVQHIWQVSDSQHENFLVSTAKNIGFIVFGGLGFILVSISAGLAGAAGRGWTFRGLAVAANLVILFWLFIILVNFSLPRSVKWRTIRLGAAVAAVGLVTLQYLGGYILARQLKSFDALYSYFAVALGLLFWIYLQAQLLYYAVVISVVSSRKLWPRSLDAAHPTAIDKKLATKVDNDY